MGGGLSRKKAQTTKMLLLGGANVGKSTIFRQMHLVHSNGFSGADRCWAKGCIIENLLQTMNELANVVESVRDEDQLLEDSDEIYKFFLQYRLRDSDVEPPPVDLKIWEAVKRMWADARVKNAFKTGSVKMKLPESANHVLDNLERISTEGYVPSNEDILRLRHATKGSSRLEFDVEAHSSISPGKTSPLHVLCIDVGGHAHQQTEWEKHATELDAVVYICALSEYDAERSKDRKNLLQLQFDMLKEICDSECFADARVLVLLNKCDLLVKKLERAREGKSPSVRETWVDYGGKDEKDEVVSFFKHKVTNLIQGGRKNCPAKNKSSSKRLDHAILESCATDTQMTETVLRNLFRRLT